MVNSSISKLSKPLASGNRLSLVQPEKDESANQFLLDFTHKYDKKIYCHRKLLKELSYPDVPPNSFNFDSFDVIGFLDSIKQIQESSLAPEVKNIDIKTFEEDRAPNMQLVPFHLDPVDLAAGERNSCSIASRKRKRGVSADSERSHRHLKGESETKQFRTAKDMRENATLQLRKIKFFWRGTQTNLPYIFKKIKVERNLETGENEMFEKFEYSKKRIKTGGKNKF